MTALPHIGVGVGSGSSVPPTPSTSGTCDPSLLFDLGDFLMNEGNDIPTFVNIHAPIKEEPEVDIDENSSKYVHSPIGLPIPRRSHNNIGYGFTPNSLTEPPMSSSPSMWTCPSQPVTCIPFPATPFNTPSQGVMFAGPDLKSIFMSGSDVISEANPTLPLAIKEEVLDLDTDLETMKTMSMFPMEEDDIFQVDKADLIQGPTLAELNANDESLLSDLNFDDFLLPSQYAGSTKVKVMSASNCDPNTGTGRFRIPDLNASAFPTPPTLSTFELLKAKNNVAIVSEEELSQLGSSQMAFELDQLQTELSVPNSGTPLNISSMETVSELPSTSPALLSVSLPANFGHVILPKLTRRTEEGRVKPPPPYPTSPPQKGNNSTLQDLLSLRSPGRLPSPSAASGSHSPSPTAQRPSHWAGARQRTVSNSTPLPSTATAQSMPKSPSLAATNPLLLARLSSSAPAPSILGSSSTAGENAWQRREPRTRLLSTSSLVEEVHGSTSSISTVGILSPGSFDFSHDEGFDSEEDSDHYEDFEDSDSDSGGSDDDGREPRPGSSSAGMSKKERYFWQYNVQAKGPKGHRINLTTETIDPHVLNEVQDPVFSPYCSVDGIKHSGKARRGDGNDLTPNPRKLHNIGRELDKLNRLINDMTPVSELPMAVRPKSRKEKNKLASRACRLKKKAQHEANKVKLYGLEQEHRKLMNAIAQSKHLVAAKFEVLTAGNHQQQQQEVTSRIDRMMKSTSKVKIAGHSTEFVNRVLERVKAGEPSGGLDEL